jgi:hypothetical protein
MIREMLKRNARRLLTLLALTLLATACGDGKPEPPPEPAPGPGPYSDGRPVIEGRVFDENDRPLPGVEVHLRLPFGAGAAGQAGLRAETDAQGRFVFDVEGTLSPVTDSPVELKLEKDGYVTNHHRFPSYKPGRGFSVSAGMVLAGTLTGRVLAEEGTPLADALVYAIRPDVPGVRRLVEVIHTKTGEDGAFRLGGLPGGARLDVGVKAPEYVAGLVLDVDVPAGGSKRIEDFVVRRGKTIAGRVVLADGKGPVHRAGVRVFKDPVLKDFVVFGRRGIHAAGGISRTDEEGRFAVTGLEDGDWDVDAVTLGLAGVRPGATDVAAGTKNVELVFVRATNVKIRVLDGETGEPIRKFRVAIQSLTGPKAFDGSPALTEEAEIHSPIGQYGFPAREDEIYGLEIVVDGYEVARRKIGPLKGGKPTIVTVPLIPRE